MKYWFFDQPVVLKVRGDDAPRYLNSRLTNDIRKLKHGATLLAAALTAQGRTEALFSVLHLENSYWIISDAGGRNKVYEAFRRFLVADRVEVIDESNNRDLLHLVLDSETKASISGLGELAIPEPGKFQILDDSFAYSRKRGFSFGVDILLPRAKRERLVAELAKLGAVEVGFEAQELARLKAGIPSFPQEIGEQYLFSESGLVEAVSYNKGCYVGQEVIEKVAAYGRLPFRLYRATVAGDGAVNSGQTIKDRAGAALGSVVSAAFDSGAQTWFLLVRLKAAESYSELSLSEDARRVTVTEHP